MASSYYNLELTITTMYDSNNKVDAIELASANTSLIFGYVIVYSA